MAIWTEAGACVLMYAILCFLKLMCVFSNVSHSQNTREVVYTLFTKKRIKKSILGDEKVSFFIKSVKKMKMASFGREFRKQNFMRKLVFPFKSEVKI